MNIEEFRDYCLAKKGVTEGFPFDSSTLVFKVMDKMFALTNVDNFVSINLKCDPELAVELRDQYESVQPGYHMSKKHWNTVTVDQDASDQLILAWTDASYQLIVDKLPKKRKEELSKL
ncbi:MmcQ/YjbR family DNA-binding protein [Reichenbachiella agariperforans]|uniref:Predicted DNA-binding protein, MmcQ/YjbR family n=1 Tax=Reichenbachiella agariperforans TaxID=156994 RepID=A0A1M6RES4_REIAG|nr:MmcQ/YjbR family DNA-binding protein [Reichenbachiella agariperforans]MBU2915355.1 MmcQ/YjbR family DNA-binding protein [Reichenbachiella agariperforans]SHK30857.1 Predicted DNA-binding protein, MmcQ/YjbR family [Reichenbachiella agariperforans]